MVLIKEILERIKQHTGAQKDSDIARILNVEPQNVFNWKKRETIPWNELCAFAINEKLSFDWLLTGKEEEDLPGETSREIDLLMKLVDAQSKRIDELNEKINNAIKLITRYKDEVEKVWSVINTKDASLATVNESIREITMRLVDIREDMNHAADQKDVTLLKKANGE